MLVTLSYGLMEYIFPLIATAQKSFSVRARKLKGDWDLGVLERHRELQRPDRGGSWSEAHFCSPNDFQFVHCVSSSGL